MHECTPSNCIASICAKCTQCDCIVPIYMPAICAHCMPHNCIARMRRHLRPMSCLLPSHGCSSKCTHAHSWAESENMFLSSGAGNAERFIFPVFWPTMAAMHCNALECGITSVPQMHTCSLQSILLRADDKVGICVLGSFK